MGVEKHVCCTTYGNTECCWQKFGRGWWFLFCRGLSELSQESLHSFLTLWIINLTLISAFHDTAASVLLLLLWLTLFPSQIYYICSTLLTCKKQQANQGLTITWADRNLGGIWIFGYINLVHRRRTNALNLRLKKHVHAGLMPAFVSFAYCIQITTFSWKSSAEMALKQLRLL